MVPVVSVVGRSGAGKTSLLEKLIPELHRRGYRIAVIKHTDHPFDLDTPGKDSWRLFQAGSQTVILAGPEKLAHIQKTEGERTLEEVAAEIRGADLILTEGCKSSPAPKIAILGEGESPESFFNLESVVAVVREGDLAIDLPHFAPQDVQGIADFIEEQFLKNRPPSRVAILVDGRSIPIYQKFVGEIVEKTVRGMIGALRGGEKARRIQILIEEPDET